MTTVIIPAAGLATRLRPISNFTSKSMIPVNGKPAISYILDQIKDWATDIRIVYGKSDDIINYCSKVYSHLPISFYKQEDPLGPLHAIYCGLSHLDSLSSDDAVVWLGDTIVLDYNHSKAISECSIVYHEVPDWDRWCLIDDKGNLFDKPVQDPGTDRALVGIYQFNSLSKMSILVDDIISSNETVKGEYQISQLLDCYRNKEQVKTNEWYDCGDFPSLYESRARLLNRLSRDDNQLYVDTISGTITKSGKRCRSEIEWYKEAPKKLLPFIPTIYEIDNESYTMEFCPGTSLQDIFVYENLKEDTVNYTLDKILTVYNKCFEQQITRSNKSSIYMWIDKNLERFNNYDKYAFIDKQDLLLVKNVVKSESYHDLIKGNNFVNNIHGDLHFGNILFDYNTGKVKFILEAIGIIRSLIMVILSMILLNYINLYMESICGLLIKLKLIQSLKI